MPFEDLASPFTTVMGHHLEQEICQANKFVSRTGTMFVSETHRYTLVFIAAKFRLQISQYSSSAFVWLFAEVLQIWILFLICVPLAGTSCRQPVICIYMLIYFCPTVVHASWSLPFQMIAPLQRLVTEIRTCCICRRCCGCPSRWSRVLGWCMIGDVGCGMCGAWRGAL